MRPFRRPTRPALLCAALLACVLLRSPAGARPAPALKPAPNPRAAATGPVTPAGGYLADDVVLAQVGDRKITVREYANRWLNAYEEFKPKDDSLGRAEFLATMVQGSVLGQSADAAGYQTTVEDRAAFRSYREQVLSNLLYFKDVSSNSRISEDSMRTVATYYGRDLRLRLLYFRDRSQAEFVRRQLLSGRLPWSVASTKYAVKTQTVIDGITEWKSFEDLPIEVAIQIWPLRLGEVSPIVLAEGGYHLVQVAQERPRKAASFSALRLVLKIQLRGLERETRRKAIQAAGKQGQNVVYDSTNIGWASSHFRDAVHIQSEDIGMHTEIDATVPEFAVFDASRPIVKWNGGQLTVADVVREYGAMSPLARPNLSTVERFMGFVDAIILRPRMIELAEQRGLDKDSSAVVLLARKREELLVTHMVEDSVFSGVTVTRADRKAYYDAHPVDFTSYAMVRFATIVRPTQAEAEEVKRAIDRGASVDSIVAADSLRHVKGTGTGTRSSKEEGSYYKVLFEELHPGKCTVVGPDRDKLWGVMYLYSYDPGHLVPFEQLETTIDESVRNIKGEAALTAWIGRLSRRYRIVSHPELVMRLDLRDHSLDND